MEFFYTLGKMVVILVAIMAGYAANRLGYLGGEIDQKLSKLLLNISMPAMIVSTVITGDTQANVADILSLMKVSLVFYGMALLLAVTIPHFMGGTSERKGAWRFAITFSNVGFIGYPVVEALFGTDALFYAAILVLPCNLLSYTMGPLMLAGKGHFHWQQMVSPCVVAAVVALLLVLTGVRPPELVGETLSFLGSIAVPLSLLVIGSLLAGLPVRQVFASPQIWLISVLRLLVMPAILFFLLKPMELEPLILGVAVTQMAMPVAVNGTMMSIDYGGDTEALAQVTFLTTLASIVTIPLIVGIFL